MVKESLNNRSDLQEYLFIRGFFITNSEDEYHLKEFPFYSNWTYEQLGSYQFLTHKQQDLTYLQTDERIFFLVGHAYNPFTMEYEEEKILEKIANHFSKGKEEYFDAIDELTGLFLLGYIENDEIFFLLDPFGFQSGYYGIINHKLFITSHIQIIGDLYDLEIDSFVNELIHYKWYNRILGPYLPGDLSKYSKIKRIIPNNYYMHCKDKITFERFYPTRQIQTCTSKTEYEKIINEAARIMKNNMILIAKKWENPQISLTGGIDSTTTFAAANGYYEEYETFSYISSEQEAPDAEAAEKIAENFDVTHTTYSIPTNNTDLKDYDIFSKIIDHNNGYIQYVKDNEKRKRVTLLQDSSADVEVKSWGSEATRAIYYKQFGRKSFPKLSGKLYRNIYKIFLQERVLARQVDELFDEFIEKYSHDTIQHIVRPTDLFDWEVVWGSWAGTNISEMRISFDLTVPYSNRKLLNLLYKVPLDLRISDQHHLDMKRYLNEELYDMNIQVNSKGTELKTKGLNFIFSMNMHLPF